MQQITSGMTYFPGTMSATGQYFSTHRGYAVHVFQDESEIWCGMYGTRKVYGYSKEDVIEKIQYRIDNPQH